MRQNTGKDSYDMPVLNIINPINNLIPVILLYLDRVSEKKIIETVGKSSSYPVPYTTEVEIHFSKGRWQSQQKRPNLRHMTTSTEYEYMGEKIKLFLSIFKNF